MSLPLCTIVIPASHAEKTIALTLDSLLAQTCPLWLAQIVIDGSAGNEATYQIAHTYAERDRRFRIQINEYNQGVAAARNRGVEAAFTPWVAFLDSDDVYHPDKLEKHLTLAEERNADFVCSAYNMINYPDRTLRNVSRVPEKITYHALIKKNLIGCSTVMLKTKLARDNPMQKGVIHEDYLCWLRCLQGCTAWASTEPLVDVLLMPHSRNANKWRSIKGVWEIYRKFLRFPFMRSAQLMCAYSLAGIVKYV